MGYLQNGLLDAIEKSISYPKKAEAVKLGAKALERTSTKSETVAWIYSLTGSINRDLGEFDKALKFHLKALEIRRAVLPEGSRSIGTSLYNIGVTYQNLGNNDKAQEYFDEAKKILGD